MKKNIAKLVMISLVATGIYAEKINIAVNPGVAFFKRAPQLAIWVEDQDGAYIDTLFVTKKASGNNWIGSPKDGRPEALPDWYNSKGQNPAAKLSKDELDATTSATPKKGMVITKDLNLEQGKTYVFKCQANQSFDYNDFYTKKNSGVDGQPAVLYTGKITPSGTETEIKLELSQKNAHITTADKILESVFVVVK